MNIEARTIFEKATAEKLVPKEKASVIGNLIFFSLVLAVLWQGWLLRDIKLITAEHGTGYALGVAGGVMMLALLFYPLRKRWRAMRRFGAVKHWFRFHMMLGIVGPSSILLHANFNLGALNSNVALMSMLVVAASGLFGRYFYARIHYGLYGATVDLRELRQDAMSFKSDWEDMCAAAPVIRKELERYEAVAIRDYNGILADAWRLLRLTLLTRLVRQRVMSEYCRAIAVGTSDMATRRDLSRSVRRNVNGYFDALRRIAGFQFYTRLFSMWHVLHLPLFVMLVISGIVHVIAVHMY